MYKFKGIILLTIIIIILTGCSDVKKSRDDIVEYSINKKYVIEIKNGIGIKRITEKRDVDYIFKYINSIKLMNINSYNENLNDKDKYKITIKDDDNKTLDFITIVDNKLFHKGKWYKIDDKYIITLSKIYTNLNYTEKVDRKATLIAKGRANRLNLPLQKGLEGKWIDIDGNIIEFNKNYIKQENHVFKYNIVNKYRDAIVIEGYGIKGMFIKDEKLFDMKIKFDKSRCNIVVNKEMKFYLGPNIKYRNELIYLESDGKNSYEFGEFDSYFFFNENLRK